MAEIVSLHRESERLAKRTADIAIRIGQLLCSEESRRKSYVACMVKDLPFHQSTAWKYVRRYEEVWGENLIPARQLHKLLLKVEQENGFEPKYTTFEQYLIEEWGLEIECYRGIRSWFVDGRREKSWVEFWQDFMDLHDRWQKARAERGMPSVWEIGGNGW